MRRATAYKRYYERLDALEQGSIEESVAGWRPTWAHPRARFRWNRRFRAMGRELRSRDGV